MTVEEFLKTADEQMKKMYWKKFAKVFSVMFSVMFVILGSLSIFIFKFGMDDSALKILDNSLPLLLTFMFIGLAAFMSFIHALASTRGYVFRSLKIEPSFENINLFEALTYYVKRENKKFTNEEVKVMVEQYYENSRLSELKYLTVITEKKTKQQSTEIEKVKINEDYFAKTREVKSRSFIRQHN